MAQRGAIYGQEAVSVTEQLPFDDQFGKREARKWCGQNDLNWTMIHGDGRPEAIRVYIKGPYYYNGGGLSLECGADFAWRKAVASFCSETKTDLPWRKRPDLSTVEACLRALTEAGCDVKLREVLPVGSKAYRAVVVLDCSDGMTRCYGEGDARWTLEVLQRAARDALTAIREAQTPDPALDEEPQEGETHDH